MVGKRVDHGLREPLPAELLRFYKKFCFSRQIGWTWYMTSRRMIEGNLRVYSDLFLLNLTRRRSLQGILSELVDINFSFLLDVLRAFVSNIYLFMVEYIL